MEQTMFERLQMLPLLQGMSTAELENFVFKVQLDFNQHTAGEQIVSQDDNCKKLIFVLSGTMSVQYRDTQIDIVVTEEMSAPTVIEPHSMFGMKQRFTRDYTFESDGSTMTVPKATFLDSMMGFSVIRSNMLNSACNKMQQATNLLMQPIPDTVIGKLQRLFRSYCITLQGKKVFKIKMETIASIIGETRLNVSNALKQLRDNEIIMQYRSEVTIPDMQKFINYK